MASTLQTKAQPAHRGKIMTGLSKVFGTNPAGLDWGRGVMFIDIVLVPLVVFWSIGHEQYLLSAVFGVVLTLLVDRGGAYGQRAVRTGIFTVFGAGVTALGFSLAGSAWG